ncbi:transmembrane and coiled-coil domains protein 2-like isoform X5 [Dermacentor andersoni]|uniref:transmembrane and coiled-coil domains protein 2-like isoform X5 n=1 Tax=Dermacentor andersoni TaxID=34620 RepID=UPI002417DAC1|nr:transmembrane and coiled-coil domains protein 2-like isoform X5 [Dermacentor andersoni]
MDVLRYSLMARLALMCAPEAPGMKRKKSPQPGHRVLVPPADSPGPLSPLQHGPPPMRARGSSAGSLDDDMVADNTTLEGLGPALVASSSLLANGGAAAAEAGGGAAAPGADETDTLLAHTPDLHRTRAALEHVSHKIARTRELIKAEQTTRDDNVNEYLKLAANADRQQMQRIKSVFEKKNQKCAQSIAQLQRKLEGYIRRKRELETHGATTSSSWQPRDVLQNVGQGISGVVGNIKGGLSGLASVAHSSTDNKYASDEDSSSLTSESSQMASVSHHSGAVGGGMGSGAATASPRHPPLAPPQDQPPLLGVASPSVAPPPLSSTLGQSLVPEAELEPLLAELAERREECQRLAEEIEALKNQLHHECSYFSQALQEERYRYERLEEQMNDLIELHQNEMENLKQGMADMEEKVQYQSEERLRDVQELLESCQTRISRMEHQQHQQLQQLVSLDALDNSQARALGLKLVNVLLMLLQLALLLVSTIANIAMPFLQSRLRIITTALLILAIVSAAKQWQELSAWFRLQLNEALERWK